MNYDTTLPTAEIEQMLKTIEPTWELADATPVSAGHHAVARLTVDTPEARRDCYLKATPPEKGPTIHLEARLLAGVGARSEIPVPSLDGVVDEHDRLPAPYVLLSAVPGNARSRLELPSVRDETLQRIARQSGRYLAQLHKLDAVGSYGFLAHDGPVLTGEQPETDFATVTVADPSDDWTRTVHNWATATLDNLEDTRFPDVVAEARPVIESRIDALEGPFEPVLARIDNSIENVLVDDGDLTALIDWEFTIAATSAYDLVCVAWSLAGGPYLFADDVTDRRPLVREALLDGYADYHTGDAVERYRANRACYELLSLLRSMVHLEDWYQLFDLGNRIEPAAVRLREELDQRLAAARN